MSIAIAFVLFITISTPIAFVLGLTALTHIITTGNPNFLVMIPQRMFTGINTFTLMAIPFFIMLGELLNRGGLAVRLINFARVLVGHLRGGLCYVNILASMFLATIMGSATAEAAAMTSIMVPEMEKDGYDKKFSVALTCSTAIIGPIIPPGLQFVIYAVMAEVSVGEMFMSGIAPGIILVGCFAVVVFMATKNKNSVARRATAYQLRQAVIQAAPALSIPLIMLIGISAGVFTPTEAAILACVVALILGFLYKNLKVSDLPKILLYSGVMSSTILLIIGTANIFGWTLAIQMVPQKITQLVVSISNNPLIFLMLVNVVVIIIGCFMETLAVMIILIPVLLPVAIQLGIDPVHFGLVLILASVIGLITPPVGLNLFICSTIAKISLEDISKAMGPFVFASIVALMFVTIFPELSLYIPRFFLKY